MAQADAVFTSDVALFTLGLASHIATLKDAEVTRRFEKKESTAAQDVARYPVAGREEFTIRSTHRVEVAGVLLSLAGTRVAVALQESGTGDTYAGTGLVTECTHSFPDEQGAQTETITIEGGVLAKA